LFLSIPAISIELVVLFTSVNNAPTVNIRYYLRFVLVPTYLIVAIDLTVISAGLDSVERVNFPHVKHGLYPVSCEFHPLNFTSIVYNNESRVRVPAI
jgi:hypothetical protein